MVALKDPPMCTLCAPQARPTWWRGSRLAFSAAILVSDVAGCKCCVIGKVLLCLKHKRALLALTYRRFCGSLYPVYYSRVLPSVVVMLLMQVLMLLMLLADDADDADDATVDVDAAADVDDAAAITISPSFKLEPKIT